MEMLEDLYIVAGWDSLTDHQKDVLFVVFQDHSKMYQGARINKMVRVAADPENDYQVHVYYENEWFHYGIDTKAGRSVWY